MKSSLNSLLILSALSLSLVGCNSQFAGSEDSAFFKVSESSVVSDPMEADDAELEDSLREPAAEDPVGEDPVGEDPVAPKDSSDPVAPKDSSDPVAPKDSSDPVVSKEDPGSSSSGSSGGSMSGGSSGGSSSGSSSGGSSGGVVMNPCEAAKDAQSCQDLKCMPITEGNSYVSCQPPKDPLKPDVPVSSVNKDCSNVAPEFLQPGKSKKVIICHQRGNGGYHTIVIACPAVKAHVDHHNDSLGVCKE